MARYLGNEHTWAINDGAQFLILIVLELRKWKLRRLQKKYSLTIWVVL